MKGGQKWLIAVLVVAIAATIGGLVYVASDPGAGERFTEFYLLGPEGKAGGYPSVVKVGTDAHLMVGIVNHEGQETSYSLKIVIGDTVLSEVGPIMLMNGGKWEEDVAFTPTQAGGRQKVEFVLLVGDDSPSTQSVYLWIDIVE